MTPNEFVREFAPFMAVYGADNFPPALLNRMFEKIKHLDQAQRQELYNLILDNCEFAPKIPRILELISIVKTRHRAGPYQPPTQTDNEPRTPEVAAKAIATIHSIFNKTRKV